MCLNSSPKTQTRTQNSQEKPLKRWHNTVSVRQPSSHDNAAICKPVDEKRGVDDLVAPGLNVEEGRDAPMRDGVETMESRIAPNVEEESIRWTPIPTPTSCAENLVDGGSDELFSFRGTDPAVDHARVGDQKVALAAPGLREAQGVEQGGVVGEGRRELSRKEPVESRVAASADSAAFAAAAVASIPAAAAASAAAVGAAAFAAATFFN